MAIIELPITDGFYVSRSLPIAAQECVNYYPTDILLTTGELLRVALFGTPGIRQLATTGTVVEQNRGSWVLNGVPYFVNGTQLYRLNADFTLDSLGTIVGTDKVQMADNGTQLMILVPLSSTGYIFTTGPDTLTTVTDADFTASGNPKTLKFMDGYFVFTTNQKKIITSNLNNGLAYLATDFGSAEADPDSLVNSFPFKGQLFVFGTETTEVFSNVGGVSFPFQRIPGFILSKGLFAKDSIVQAQDSLMWVGGGKNEGPAIWALSGNSTVKISTVAIDSLLEKETSVSGIFAWSYSQDGAYFVGWTLATTTIVYDTQSRRWHERKSSIVQNDTLVETRWRVNSIVKAYDKIIVADFLDGRIGEANLDIYSEYGSVIQRVVSTRLFANQGRSFTVPMIEVTTESGVGNLDALDPHIRMSKSADGKVFSDERARSVGKTGEYNLRQVWRRNGRLDRFVIFKFEFSEKAKAVIWKVEADIVAAI